MTQFQHPQHQLLANAKIELDCAKYFLSQDDVPNLLKRKGNLYANSLETEINYLSVVDHPIVFIGDIGVGKTTGISQLFNLIIEQQKLLQQRVILTTGGGGTTICEVSIQSGSNYSIKVEPLAEDQVKLLVNDWVDKFFSKDNNVGVSKEVDRAIRNMTNLALPKAIKIDGKLVKAEDPAVILAQEYDTPDLMIQEIWQRINYSARSQTEIVYSDHEQTGEEWLKSNFKDINNGAKAHFPLPQRINITIPQPLLPSSPYSIEVVDTKGVDKTAIREDLTEWIKNPYSIIVLCTRFNSAPDISVQQFFEYLNEIGLHKVIQERVRLFVLPRTDEALAGDAGEMVESVEEGYLLKETQIRDRLQEFGASEIPINFFNAESDDSQAILLDFAHHIDNLRNTHVKRLNSQISAMNELMENTDTQLALASQNFVNQRLQSCVKHYHRLPFAQNNIPSYLTKELENTHQRTVWAMVKRNGDWDPSINFLIGYASRAIAQQRSEKALGGFKELLTILLDDSELATTHSFMNQLLNNIDQWHDTFLNDIEEYGKVIFLQISNADFWEECLEIYGKGLPFRQMVIDSISAWFEEETQAKYQDTFLHQVVQTLWEQKVLVPIKELCQDEEIEEYQEAA
jgi:hypothetical protein